MTVEHPMKRLLAQTVDHAARHNPGQVFAVVSKGSELSDGFLTLTMEGMSRAVNAMCWWIEHNVGASQPRQTLAYMGGNDARYCIFLLACQKTGHRAFFPSTRNSDEAHCHLLEVTECSRFFFSEERNSHARKTQQLCSKVQTLQVPTMKAILADPNGLQTYRYDVRYADVEDSPTCIIHSSGTTGMPKPVSLTNGFFMCLDALPRLQWPQDRQPGPFFDLDQRDLVLATTPFFHLIGLISFSFSIFHSVPILIGPEKPPSVDYLTRLMQMCKPTAAVFAPSILEELSRSDEALECLQMMKKVQFGGAPLARDVGDRVRQYTPVVSNLGSSEMGFLPTLVPAEEMNWDYFEWNPSYGIDMQYRGDGVYEMVIPRHKHAREFQGIFHTFPECHVYHTKDLFTPHPTNSRLWKYSGRQDDVIVLNNGEKFNPTTMETIIEGHPLVSRALIVGQSRFQAALLVEPMSDAPEMNSKTFIEEIWPTVQAANRTAAAHGRVMKSKIGFATKTKPFQRTPKGTTLRRAVIGDYEKEIGSIYETGLEDELAHYLPESLDEASILEFVRQILARTLEGPSIPVDKDLYAAGLDSLMTIQVAKLLQMGLQACQPALKPGIIQPQTIYAHPTVERLARFLLGVVKGEVQSSIPREEKLQSLVDKYTSDLPVTRHDSVSGGPDSPSIVVLTGSTGSLGTYLLHSLLKTDSICKIYCLNRSDAASRQKKGMEEKNLCISPEDWAKVQFLQVSFGLPQFGLEEAKYQELLESVDTVIHNAWKVDFNHSVESFEETHIQGVRRFVDFSLASRHNAHIHFVSSISTVGGWTSQMGSSVPEMSMEDSAVVLPQGYGESKHVAERICLEASRRCRVRSTVYRVGQIAGPTTRSGQWNPHEWLPTIVATSKALGKIPASIGAMPVDWVPVDNLASIMTEIVSSRHGDSGSPSAFFHLNNPERVPWSSLLPAIHEKYAVEPVPFGAWVNALEIIPNPSSEDVAEKPALKLLGFYRGLADESHAAMSVGLDVAKAQRASATMRSLRPISASLMANWLQQWDF